MLYCLALCPAPCNVLLHAGPIKALVQERQQDWQARYGTTLGLKVLQLSGDAGDSDELEADLEAADIICATPEKFGEARSGCCWAQELNEQLEAIPGCLWAVCVCVSCCDMEPFTSGYFGKAKCLIEQKCSLKCCHTHIGTAQLRLAGDMDGLCCVFDSIVHSVSADQVTRKITEKGSLGFFAEVCPTHLHLQQQSMLVLHEYPCGG